MIVALQAMPLLPSMPRALPRVLVVFAGLACLLAGSIEVSAKETYKPEDPFAAIDGEPIYLGELNLILAQRGVKKLDAVDINVKRAVAALVVRRRLALLSLQAQGGAALERIVDRQIDQFAQEAKRQGSSFEKQAKALLTNEKGLIADLTWRAAWSEYLKSNLTDKNLRRYFEMKREQYAGGRWEVSQIFVSIVDPDPTSLSATTTSMNELAESIRSSSDVETAFANAARDHSESGSADNGGKVGWVEKDGDLPSAVMKVVRETKPGQLSKAVQSPLGMHLVFVHQYEPGKMTFGDLTDQAQLRRDATNALFDALVKKQSSAKVVWFISALKPPASMQLIPQ